MPALFGVRELGIDFLSQIEWHQAVVSWLTSSTVSVKNFKMRKYQSL